MAREKSGLGYEDVVDAVEVGALTAREFLKLLSNNTDHLFDSVEPIPLSGKDYSPEQTPFTEIDDFTIAFETYRTQQGDTKFECQNPSSIDAAAKSQIIDAKIKVLMALNHIEKNSLAKAFAQHLKSELSYKDTKNLEAQELSDLWAAFKNWKELSKAHSDAGESSWTPFLPEDLEKVEAQEKLIAGAKAMLEYLEEEERDLRSDAGKRARNNRESSLYEMASAADSAQIEFNRVLSALDDTREE